MNVNDGQQTHVPMSQVRNASSECLCAGTLYCLCGIHNSAAFLRLAGSQRAGGKCLLRARVSLLMGEKG